MWECLSKKRMRRGPRRGEGVDDGKKRDETYTDEAYDFYTLVAAPPLVAGATTFPPLRGGTMGAGHCAHVMRGKRREVYSAPWIGVARELDS